MPDHLDILIRMIDRWKAARIVVAGDYMLDRYVYGNADRLSPDAPVPVLAVDEEENRPGGAGNVVRALRALGCDVACIGVVGDDAMAQTLRDELASNEWARRYCPRGREDAYVERLSRTTCDVSGLITAKDGRPTTVKFNIVGKAQHRHAQKMFRIDSESRAPIDAGTVDRLLAAAEAALDGAAVLCIEDYNKGALTPDVCQRLIAMARTRGVPVLVDPAAISDYAKYRGATCITPNRTEASLASRREEPGEMATFLLEELALSSIVLTLDKQGALLLEHGGEPVVVPTVAREVYDVTGAGDIVLATLAAGLANGADWRGAVELANAAAGLEVERFGAVPIWLDEVLLSLLELRNAQQDGADENGAARPRKLRTLDDLLIELEAHRNQGRRIAFTNGCFDILHAGHVSYLRQARRAGDLLVVGLNSDASIRRIKGEGRPVNHEADRVLVLNELESVSYIVLFDEDTPIELISRILPDALVKGADYKREQVVGHDVVEANGGEVVLVPLVEGRSTTNIIRKLAGEEGAGQPESWKA